MKKLVTAGVALALLAGCSTAPEEVTVQTVPESTTTTSTTPPVDLVAVNTFLETWKSEEWRVAFAFAQAKVDEQVAQQRKAQASVQKTQGVQTTKPSQPQSTGGGNGFLGCVKNRESRGQYGAVNGSSGAAGAYQFMPQTWNNTARHAGRPDLVGKNPATASAADQDAMAQHLYSWQGAAPWGGGC